MQTASVVSAELEETDSNASALTIGDPEPPKKQFCFKNPTFEVLLHCSIDLFCRNFTLLAMILELIKNITCKY